MARWHNGRGGVLSSSRSGGRGACGRRQPTIMDSPSFHSLSFLVDVFVFVIVFVSVLNFVLFFFTATASKLDSPSFHSPIFLVDVVVFVFVFVFDLSGFADDNRPSWIFTQLPRPRLQFVFAITKDCRLTGEEQVCFWSTQLFVSIPLQSCLTHKKIVVDCVDWSSQSFLTLYWVLLQLYLFCLFSIEINYTMAQK